MKSLLVSTLSLLLFTAASTFAAVPEGWTDNYAKALEQAKAENKMVLLDFTGSDWCAWCQKIDKEIFQTRKFKEYAAKHLVLVKVDFPDKAPQSAKVKAQNEKLQEKYDVDSFPTLMVVNAKGKKVWRNDGFLEGGPNAFIKAVNKKL